MFFDMGTREIKLPFRGHVRSAYSSAFTKKSCSHEQCMYEEIKSLRLQHAMIHKINLETCGMRDICLVVGPHR